MSVMIQGTVADAAGIAIPNAQVVDVCGPSCPSNGRRARTAADGSFTLILPYSPGTPRVHQIGCRAAGYSPEQRTVDPDDPAFAPLVTGGYSFPWDPVLQPLPPPPPAAPPPPATPPQTIPGDEEGSSGEPGSAPVAVAHHCGSPCKTKDSPCLRHTTNPRFCYQHLAYA